METSSHESIKHDVDYAFSCFDAYMRLFPRERVPHAHMCEIGPGKNLAVSLVWKSLGAERVYVADKYLKPWTADYHPFLYAALATAVIQRWPDADMSIFGRAQKGHDIEGIFPLSEDAEHLESIPDGSLDFIGSWAVLEHLYDPPRAFARFSQITRQGGLGLHQVDFRDHRDFSRPLEFLLHHYRWNEEPDEDTFAWLASCFGRSAEQARRENFDAKGLIRRVCGYHGNSYRPGEYANLWETHGFQILSVDYNMHADAAYLENFLPRLRSARTPCATLSREELGRISACYDVRKI